MKNGIRNNATWVAMTLLVAMAGCARDDTSMSSATASASDMPTLYLDQVAQLLEQGRNTQLEGYHGHLDICRKAGIPIQAIPKSDEHLIGTERWRIWRDRDRFAYRLEAWHVARPTPTRQADLCIFKLGLTGLHSYVDAQRAITLNLETGERTESDGNPDIALHTRDDAGGVKAGSQLTGPTQATVAGQPCNQWQTRHGATLCVWSGGSRWGFSDTADGEFSRSAGVHSGHIVLAANPPPDASGDALKTTAFIIGAPPRRGRNAAGAAVGCSGANPCIRETQTSLAAHA